MITIYYTAQDYNKTKIKIITLLKFIGKNQIFMTLV